MEKWKQVCWMNTSKGCRVDMQKMQLEVWYYSKKSASVNELNNKMMHKQEQHVGDQPQQEVPRLPKIYVESSRLWWW